LYNLRSLARALGGDVRGNSVSAPGPGHSAKDRSLSVTPSSAAPDGFIVHSFAGDDFPKCRDHVKARLGLPLGHKPQAPLPPPPPLRPPPSPLSLRTQPSHAGRMWSEGIDLRQLHGRLKRLREFCDLLPPEPAKEGNVIEFKRISTESPGARQRLEKKSP
jgi:hypothetical protein